MRESVETIWQRRAREYRKEIMPYLQYMLQSGFPGFVVLILIVSLFGYGTLLRNIPPQLPIIPIGIALFTPVVCWNPLRTWLHPADIVFLMPREIEMKGYIKRSMRYLVLPGVLLIGALVFLYRPLYLELVELALAWPALFVLLLLLKAASKAAAWRERQLAWPLARQGLRAVRWAAAAMIIAVFLTVEPWKAAVFSLLVIVTCIVLYRIPSRHRFPWERLIAEELRTRRWHYRFFGYFIDVPVLASRVSRRGHLTGLARLLAFRNANTYRYLFLLTLLRTEIGGILQRLLLLGALVIYLTGRAGLLEGWGTAAVYLLFIVIIAVQAAGLRHVHRHSVWRHVFPLPHQQHDDSLLNIVRLTALIAAALLSLPLLLTLIPAGSYYAVLSGFVLAAVYIGRLPRRLAKRLQQELELE